MFSVIVASAMQNDYRMMGTYTEHGSSDGVTTFNCPNSSDECYRGPGDGPPAPGDVIYVNDNGTRKKATLLSITSDATGSGDDTYEASEIEE